MKRTLVTTLVLLFSAVASSQAQGPGGQPRPAGGPPALPEAKGEVRGQIVEAEGNAPIARASVTIRSARDSSIVAGAIANANGGFSVIGLRNGRYIARATMIGYAPKISFFAITDSVPKVEVGPLKLPRVAVSLTTVDVTAERAAMALEPDRNAYSAKQVAPAASNASEVLEAVPSVQVDGDGKVSFRGNENVAVQINGRPSPIRGIQLGAFLKSLPANVVDKIEVIPNPSAKYDPEGMAGIINIVLKQNTDLGMSGGANAGIANADRYNGSGNLSNQSGPWTTFVSGGLNADNRTVDGINNRDRFTSSNALTSATLQDVLGTNGNAGQNFNATVDYKFNPRDVLSNATLFSHRTGTDNGTTTYSELNSSRNLRDKYDRTKDTKTSGYTFDYSTNWKRTFEARKHELTTELHFTKNEDDEDTNLWKIPSTSSSQVDRELDNTQAGTKQLNEQLDYMKILVPRRKLEMGYKGTQRWLDRDYLVQKDFQGSGTWTRSPLSNNFAFDENVQAAYAVLTQGKGKFDLQGGLRAEYATRDFKLASKDYPYNYTSLFPSANISFNQSDAQQMRASYSRRIRRPGTQELNPFPTFFDAQNVFIGNPNLNPEYTSAMELGYTRTGSVGTLQISPFYRYTTNVIRVAVNTDTTIDNRSVTTVSFQNLATSKSWGTDVNGQFRFGPKLSGLVGLNVFKMVTDGGSLSALSSDVVTWGGRANLTSQPTDNLTINANYFFQAPVSFEQGKFYGAQRFNFAIRQKIDASSTLVLRVLDPFNTNKFKVTIKNGTVAQTTERRFGVRAVFLGYQYNFGRPPRIRQARPEDQGPAATPFGSQ